MDCEQENEKLKDQIAELQGKLKKSEGKIARLAEDRDRFRSERNHWITMAHFQTGLARDMEEVFRDMRQLVDRIDEL